ncbi:MAG TPA: cation:proton antiporter [Bryobacteraceae bacterium]|jgi:Kef-type K+ transport system membrane component KefB|nr:cation:proton antiporter [Bryobacteraceae bacterium]
MDGPTLTLLLVQIGLILAIPLCMAKLLERLAPSPLVVELVCGVLLGPSVFGMAAPKLFARVFPALGRATQAREAVTELGLLLFVFMAGLELQPKRLRTLGPPILWSSFLGILAPLALGVGSVLLWPEFWRNKAQSNVPLLALFVGTILSISALPVIARILMDLNLMKTELGAIVMSAAMLDDLAGWGLFAVILGNFGGEGHTGRNWWASLVAVALVFGLILNLSNKRIQRAVGWLNLPKDTLQLKLTFLVFLTASILSEVVGTHATLGAFLAGVALGRIPDARKLAHESFYRTTAGIFATLYFVSIGLKANFVANFDPRLVAFVLVVACVGKIGGVFLGARLGGKSPHDALMVALGMNARGAMGIVLTTIALEYGLIDQRIFVALVIMALVTSVLSAVGIKRLLGGGAAQPDAEEQESELLPYA